MARQTTLALKIFPTKRRNKPYLTSSNLIAMVTIVGINGTQGIKAAAKVIRSFFLINHFMPLYLVVSSLALELLPERLLRS